MHSVTVSILFACVSQSQAQAKQLSLRNNDGNTQQRFVDKLVKKLVNKIVDNMFDPTRKVLSPLHAAYVDNTTLFNWEAYSKEQEKEKAREEKREAQENARKAHAIQKKGEVEEQAQKLASSSPPEDMSLQAQEAFSALMLLSILRRNDLDKTTFEKLGHPVSDEKQQQALTGRELLNDKMDARKVLDCFASVFVFGDEKMKLQALVRMMSLMRLGSESFSTKGGK